MPILGIRFSTTALSLALLDGSRAAPTIVEVRTTKLPKGFRHPQLLEWIERELTDFLKKHSPAAVVIKGAEPMASRGGSFVTRCDFEAVAMLTAERCGIPCKGRTVKASLAKALFGKGKARYLASVTPSGIPDFVDRPTEEQEAIHAACFGLA